METCSNKECIKTNTNKKKTVVRSKQLSIMQSKTIDELLSIYSNRTTKKTPFGWLTWIHPHYLKFAKEIYTQEDIEFFGQSRLEVLYKYWANLNIKNVDDAKKTIPMCSYCNIKPRAPRIVGDVILDSCASAECLNKNHIDSTKRSMKNKYGVENISSLESMKIYRSEIMKRNHENFGDITELKRKECVKAKYGVDNVSQIEAIKEKKIDSFQEHYGKDNIFQRSDLMKEYWLNALGVENPKFKSEINIKRCLNLIPALIESVGEYHMINGKRFGIMEPTELHLLRALVDYVKVDVIETNSTVFEKMILGKSRALYQI